MEAKKILRAPEATFYSAFLVFLIFGRYSIKLTKVDLAYRKTYH